MAVGDGDGVEFFLGDGAEQGQRLAALALRMRARVHEQPVAIDLDKPRARAYPRIGVQIDDAHVGSLSRRETGSTQFLWRILWRETWGCGWRVLRQLHFLTKFLKNSQRLSSVFLVRKLRLQTSQGSCRKAAPWNWSGARSGF